MEIGEILLMALVPLVIVAIVVGLFAWSSSSAVNSNIQTLWYNTNISFGRTWKAINSINSTVEERLDALNATSNEISNISYHRYQNLSSEDDRMIAQLNTITNTTDSQGRNITNAVDTIGHQNASIDNASKTIVSVANSIQNYTESLEQFISTTVGTNSIETLAENQIITNNTYFVGALPPGINTHINITANHSVNLDILSPEQYANLITNRSYAITEQFSGSTDYVFWFNQSNAGCTPYLFTISSTSNTFITMRLGLRYNGTNDDKVC